MCLFDHLFAFYYLYFDFSQYKPRLFLRKTASPSIDFKRGQLDFSLPKNASCKATSAERNLNYFAFDHFIARSGVKLSFLNYFKFQLVLYPKRRLLLTNLQHLSRSKPSVSAVRLAFFKELKSIRQRDGFRSTRIRCSFY